MTISIIIPTYNRPQLLLQAMHSVLSQTILPTEVIIGDDSQNDLTAEIAKEKIIPCSSVPIRYFHHKPALRQTKNVDYLLQRSTSDFTLLLHDDDLLMPNCLEILLEPLIRNPQVVASFGNQYLIDAKGEIIQGSDEELNNKFYRTPEREGIIDGEWAASVQMFPNNAFLVRTKDAKEIGYDDLGRAGDAVDFYFGFRLGKKNDFFWVNKVVAKYRLTEQSITSSGSLAFMSPIVKILLEDLEVESLETKEIKNKISELMNPAISEVIRSGDKRTALKWMLSPYYNLLTLKAFKRFLMLCSPYKISRIQ